MNQAQQTIHLIAEGSRTGIRCGAPANRSATNDLPSVTCKSCLALHEGKSTSGMKPRQRHCAHTVTHGITGAKGAWCVECGLKVLEVHHRPCGECRHINAAMGGHICTFHTMAVTPGMFVTYYLVKGPGRFPLCFEASDGL